MQGSYVYTQRNSAGTYGQVTKRLIRDAIVGLEDNIDAATLWTGNDKAYFFKGTDLVKPVLDHIHIPQTILNLKGLCIVQ